MVNEIHDYAETHRNIIQLNGQDFYIDTSGLSIDPASDFAQGVKTGPVDYDQRLHTFFSAVDDHSAGEGFDVVNLREDVGVWSHSLLGVEGARSKHLTAPPLILKVRQVAQALNLSMTDQNAHPITGDNYIGHFDNGIMAIFTTACALVTTDGFTFTRVAYQNRGTTSDPLPILSKIIRVFNVGSTVHCIAQVLNELAGEVPGCVDITSTDGATFSLSDVRQRWDTIFWAGSYYSIVDASIQAGSSFEDAGTTFGVIPAGRGHWFGPTLGPNALVDLYFGKAGTMWFAEPVGQTVTEVALGPGFNVAGGNFFDANLIVTDGQTSIAYSSDGAGEIIRDVGFQNFRFAPNDVEGGLIRALASDELNLYAAIQHSTEYDSHDDECHIAKFNGRGWEPLGVIDNFFVLNMAVGWVPPTGWPVTHRALYITGIRGARKLYDIIRPTGNGKYTAWSNDFANVDDYFPDGTTLVVGGVNLDRESYTHSTTITVPTGMRIAAVSVVSMARAISGGAGATSTYEHTVIIGGTDYDSAIIARDEEDALFYWASTQWLVSPATGIAWTAAEINAMEFGVEAIDANPDISMDVIFVVVHYADDGTSGENGNIEVQMMHLPPAGSVPTVERDYFAQTWDLYEGWVDGGFIDLRGALYEFMASGIFTATEKVEVYYSLDDVETETLLGTITETGQILEFGPTLEGVSFRNFRLHFKGYASAPDEGVTDTDLGDGNLGLGDNAARTWIAQGFKIDSAQEINFAQFYMRKVGAPTDFGIGIFSDSGGSPNTGGTAYVTFENYSHAMLDTEYSWVTFKFVPASTVPAATTVWVVFTSGAIDASNYYQFRKDGSSPTYADGEAKVWNGAAWSADNSDLMFNAIADRTLTADLRGYVVEYDKRPKYRSQMQIPIDVQGMIVDEVLVDGKVATFERVYNKLVEIWDNETLVPYSVGKLRSGLCKMVAMPVQSEQMIEVDRDDDDKQTVGSISIQILEIKPRRLGDTS